MTLCRWEDGSHIGGWLQVTRHTPITEFFFHIELFRITGILVRCLVSPSFEQMQLKDQ